MSLMPVGWLTGKAARHAVGGSVDPARETGRDDRQVSAPARYATAGGKGARSALFRPHPLILSPSLDIGFAAIRSNHRPLEIPG